MNPSNSNQYTPKPLDDLKVIDLSVMLPGPLLTRILVQYGAQVTRVENLTNGDALRDLKDTSLFELINQGKRSLALDIKTEEANRIIRQLVRETDVFVEAFRQGTMERFGLGYDELKKENPELVYVSLRGFGGKHAPMAGHDLNFVSSSGVGDWFMDNKSPNYGSHYADMVGAALVPAVQILAHLMKPKPHGTHLVANIEEGFRFLFLPRAFDYVQAEKLPHSPTDTYGTFPHFNNTYPHSGYYLCQDNRWVSFVAVQSKHWQAFCEATNKKEWLPRAADSKLVPEVKALFLTASSTHWENLSLKGDKEFSCFRIITFKEHLDESQARSQVDTDPLAWCGFDPNADLPSAPPFGQDTIATLSSCGLSNEAISDWIDRKIAFQSAQSKT